MRYELVIETTSDNDYRVIVFDIDPETRAKSVLDIVESHDIRLALQTVTQNVDIADTCVTDRSQNVYPLTPYKTQRAQYRHILQTHDRARGTNFAPLL